jgi:hypothetical protein
MRAAPLSFLGVRLRWLSVRKISERPS